ncbi:hypothetical protein Ga0100231_015905 [Opitutaceae bacterium TAV4]|nr:hypothetical protein Ga0100231_015905 [Opitutaceae bacterium TAV4]RRK01165.1 hypothetical protein Ga0100230_017640 [Opitutaceae bacterium TAV3]
MFAALFLAAPPVVSGGTIDLQTLIDNPPFGKAPEAGASAEADPQALEFRGYIVDQGVRYFSLYDPTVQKSSWVSEKESGPIAIKTFDADDGALTVTQAGKTVRLKLKAATIANAPVAPVATASNPRGVRTFQPGGPNATPRTGAQIDPKRLEAIAAEVARRRAQRQAAQQGNATNAAPAPAAPAPAN